MNAAPGGHEAVCRFLVKECQADVNARDDEQKTPLDLALEFAARDEAVCLFLVTHGAAVDTRDKYQQTPLHFAAAHSREAVCQFLVAQGAAVDARDNWQQTPLHWAAQYGREAVCRF